MFGVTASLALDRARILAYRRRVGNLEQRIPQGSAALERVAWAGLQDSMPRAALLSIHARIGGTPPSVLDDPALVQLWGPRYSTYVVAARDVAVFTLGRMPPSGKRREYGQDIAERIEAHLGGSRAPFGEVGHALGVHPNALRYAAPTGRVLIDWDGARQPTIWTIPAPEMDPDEAARELLRRYLHILGPGNPVSFSDWAGITSTRAGSVFESLTSELVPVATPVGDGWILNSDEDEFLVDSDTTGAARLLPSGDVYYLLQGAERELLVPNAELRPRLWTSRVWPGALLLDGEIVGTWRRARENVTLEPWKRLSSTDRQRLAAEAASLPLPGIEAEMKITWA